MWVETFAGLQVTQFAHLLKVMRSGAVTAPCGAGHGRFRPGSVPTTPTPSPTGAPPPLEFDAAVASDKSLCASRRDDDGLAR